MPGSASVPAIVAERKGRKTRGSKSFEVGSSQDWKRIQGADFEQHGFLQKILVEKKNNMKTREKTNPHVFQRFETDGAWQGMCVKARNGSAWA